MNQDYGLAGAVVLVVELDRRAVLGSDADVRHVWISSLLDGRLGMVSVPTLAGPCQQRAQEPPRHRKSPASWPASGSPTRSAQIRDEIAPPRPGGHGAVAP